MTPTSCTIDYWPLLAVGFWLLAVDVEVLWRRFDGGSQYMYEWPSRCDYTVFSDIGITHTCHLVTPYLSHSDQTNLCDILHRRNVVRECYLLEGIEKDMGCIALITKCTPRQHFVY